MQSRFKENDCFVSRKELQSLGISTTPPKYPLYSYPSTRLKTFELCKFDGPSVLEVVKAGFYHTGSDDIVQCFHCGLKLRNWDKSDDPWVEHARHGKQCPFLISVKGIDFCRLVLQYNSQDIDEDCGRSRYTDDLIFTTAAQALLKFSCYDQGDIMKAIRIYVNNNNKVEFNASDIATIIHTELKPNA